MPTEREHSNDTLPEEIEAAIMATLRDHMEGVAWVSTFEDEGVMTRNRGLVVTLDNGGTFQLKILIN